MKSLLGEKDFNLVDLLDEQDLPLKRRVDASGHYVPRSVSKEEASAILAPQRSRPLIPEEPLGEGEQYRFHFDMTRCVGCQCCVVACNEQNNNPADVTWRRVGEIEGGLYPDTKKHHFSMACNHCLDPACLTGCPTDAYVKLDNGIVKHQSEECIGCGYCSWNCPYGVPQFNEERRIVTKCDMCHSRLAEGQLPACVAACPEEAIQVEKVNVAEWRRDHAQANAPYVPDSGMTLSTTRITVPADLPDTMIRANRHRIQPEKPHTSLIFMTVLTQLAVGGFMTLWLVNLLSRVAPFFKPIEDFFTFGITGMLLVTGLALAAAIFHLGRPLHAYKALRMWKRSWLSREVLLFALFSKLGLAYTALQWGMSHLNFSIPEIFNQGLGLFVIVLGLTGVYASAKIYQVPARPSWNTPRTRLRFFLTGFIIGPLFALVVYSFYLLSLSAAHEKLGPVFFGPVTTFLAVAALAAFLQLVVLLARLFYLRDDQPEELYGSALLLTHRFRKHFLGRIWLLVAGCFLIPLLLYLFLSAGSGSLEMLLPMAVASFACALAGGFLGRYVFFVTVVPKNMPGSFFMSEGGGH